MDMIGWPYTFFFIFTLLVVVRYVLDIIRSMFAANIRQYNIEPKELVLLGISVAYALTFLIY